MEKLLDDNLENAAGIKKLLIQNALGGNWRERYNLLTILFKCLRPRMDDKNKEDGDQALNMLLQELLKNEKGRKDSRFMVLSNEFENELNNFIEKKINKR